MHQRRKWMLITSGLSAEIASSRISIPISTRNLSFLPFFFSLTENNFFKRNIFRVKLLYLCRKYNIKYDGRKFE